MGAPLLALFEKCPIHRLIRAMIGEKPALCSTPDVAHPLEMVMKHVDSRVLLGFVVGGIIGVAIIRAFFLDPIEQMAWSMFWRGIAHGDLMDARTVFQSSTFLKCLAGFLLAGAATGVGVYLKGKRRTSTS